MIARILKLIGLFVGFAIVVGASAYLSFTFLVKAEDTVIVPDLIGRDVVYCLELLTDLGLDIKIQESVYDEQVPKHHVLFQHPEPGQEIKQGRDVRIILSKGRQQIFMPDLRNVRLAQARIIIEENGLNAGLVSKTYSDADSAGTVMAQVPGAGTTINKGAAVDLLISLGHRPAAYMMPELTGLSLPAALVQLEEMGLQTGEITSREDAEAPPNTVLSQTPTMGARVTAASRVDLIINREGQQRPSRLLRSGGGVRLFRYRLEKGLLNRHIKVTMMTAGMSFDLYDQYMKPDTEVWVLVPAYQDVTLLVYENRELVDTAVFSSWE